MYTYFIVFFVIILLGVVATLFVGFSKNQEGDPSYDQKTGTKWIRLTSLYIVSIAAGLLALFAFIRSLL
ncbi:hypothetical protein [Paenibacillus sp. N3.4]|uniref:hypothetical protein n=1 Tax=Paenibacillus sp. N3.4 TaxID=2603222 RepID=UPI0011CBF8E7|nr:hypothetical protein [Paenibacillus sp. N3.4]TXK76956.1 hypothetical protein FU659_24075 [Paenibacillus sp. N3.4]